MLGVYKYTSQIVINRVNMLNVDIRHYIYVRMTDDACVSERRCMSEGVKWKCGKVCVHMCMCVCCETLYILLFQ